MTLFLDRIDINSSLNVGCNLPVKISGSAFSFCGKVFNYKFNIFNTNWIAQVTYFSLSFSKFIFKGIGLFHPHWWIYSLKFIYDISKFHLIYVDYLVMSLLSFLVLVIVAFLFFSPPISLAINQFYWFSKKRNKKMLVPFIFFIVFY